MTVHLLRNGAFDPETTQVLVGAFDEAWASIQKSGSGLGSEKNADATRTVLAKRIIDMGNRGQRDQRELVNDALSYLAKTNLAGPLNAD